jgi:hypothetical protein
VTIEDIGRTHLNVSATVSQQQDALLRIEEEDRRELQYFPKLGCPNIRLITTYTHQIMSKHPQPFAGEDNEANLFFALRVVVQNHQRKRKYFQKRARASKKLAEKNMKVNGARQLEEVLDLVNKQISLKASLLICVGTDDHNIPGAR